AVILPFRGLRYDPRKVGDVGAATSPPFDVISPEQRGRFAAQSPANAVNLILPESTAGRDRYATAAGILSDWVARGVLVRDASPCLYAYQESYSHKGESRSQLGLLAAVPLIGDPETGILPHERTHAGPVADRLALMKATRANLSPVFGVCSGGAPVAPVLAPCLSSPAVLEFSDEISVQHKLWLIDDPETQAALCSALLPARILIADGHHRHATALAYRESMRAERGPGPWDAALFYLVDADSQGPLVLAIHRAVLNLDPELLLARLRGHFDLAESGGRDALGGVLREMDSPGPLRFAVYAKGRFTIARLVKPAAIESHLPRERSAAWCALDVAQLHLGVLQGLLSFAGEEGTIVYDADADSACDMVDAGRASLAILLRPTPFHAITDVADQAEPMPQKSTYFFPKPRTGMVFRSLDD
ncbi:MAG: DUF1015 domain-containing protein, partial [Actinomycetota bacterium]